ncbi:hypothetical protein [Vannielia litorea]|uniref:hypothetical protein n=1 Tax=Vannielia litorea TaxID=1217970 RepID=UPI001BCBD45A|nr:hypothetical protein [Vannielia litorea]MBS8228054.1 nucleoside kinase [Vannielia litorea]
MTGAAPVVHLNGYPGCGKLTIGRVLVRKIGGRLLHNHLALDAAGALFTRGTPGHGVLRQTVTGALCAAARGLPPDIPLVVTNALADSAEDRALMAPFEALAAARGAAFRPVTLEVSEEENRRRLADPARADRGKLQDVAVLEGLRRRHALLVPEGAVALDVSAMTPEAAAGEIIAVLGLLSGGET